MPETYVLSFTLNSRVIKYSHEQISSFRSLQAEPISYCMCFIDTSVEQT